MSESSVESAKGQIRRLIAMLRRSSNGSPIAQDLERRLELMDGWYATKEQLFQIGTLCHPKGLGDNLVDRLQQNSWIAEVESCRKICAVAFNELESNGPSSQR